MVTAAKEIETRAQTALASSPIYALRDVRVQQTAGNSLVLTGRVDSFYHKQMAQECIRAVAADCQVVNTIHVE